jgi:Uma2 family endonuclease
MLLPSMAIEILDSIPAAAPAALTTGPGQGDWTYEDYLALPDDGKRYEVIEGVLYVSPVPPPRHQRCLINLAVRLTRYSDEARLGELFLGPVDVLIPGGSPVQPDMLFIARDNPAVIDLDHNIRGVPDLIIEVTSPSTAGYDRREKQDLYAHAGVREYWHVHPNDATIEVLVLDAKRGAYRSLGVFRRTNLVPSEVLSELPFTVDELLS